MLAIDAHLDLSWSALGWNRDLTLTVPAIRSAEKDMTGINRGANTVSFPAMRKGEVAVALATILARAGQLRDSKLDFRTQEMAYAIGKGQLAFYRIMESKGLVRMLTNWKFLESHVTAWRQDGGNGVPLGFILSMEGADPIVSPSQLEEWRDDGLRVLGPVHYGSNAYAHGTGCPGGLTPAGRELLKSMEDARIILDVTHLADESFWQAVKQFRGPVLASHHNCRALVPGDRQLTDDQIRHLIERGSVIGAAFDDWMLYPGWTKGETSNSAVTMEKVVDHMDHISQLAGNAHHIAIGSDLDGGFGGEQSPSDLDTIADLQKLPDILQRRGYSEADIRGVMHENWLRFFQTAWTGN